MSINEIITTAFFGLSGFALGFTVVYTLINGRRIIKLHNFVMETIKTTIKGWTQRDSALYSLNESIKVIEDRLTKMEKKTR